MIGNLALTTFTFEPSIYLSPKNLQYTNSYKPRLNSVLLKAIFIYLHLGTSQYHQLTKNVINFNDVFSVHALRFLRSVFVRGDFKAGMYCRRHTDKLNQELVPKSFERGVNAFFIFFFWFHFLRRTPMIFPKESLR